MSCHCGATNGQKRRSPNGYQNVTLHYDSQMALLWSHSELLTSLDMILTPSWQIFKSFAHHERMWHINFIVAYFFFTPCQRNNGKKQLNLGFVWFHILVTFGSRCPHILVTFVPQWNTDFVSEWEMK